MAKTYSGLASQATAFPPSFVRRPSANALFWLTLISWQSVAGDSYFVERSTHLAASPAFMPLATGIPGQPGTTTYTDTNTVGGGPFFYRVGVGN